MNPASRCVQSRARVSCNLLEINLLLKVWGVAVGLAVSRAAFQIANKLSPVSVRCTNSQENYLRFIQHVLKDGQLRCGLGKYFYTIKDFDLHDKEHS